MACDICGKTGNILEDIKSEYQTNDIKQICLEFIKTVNDHIFKLRRMTNKLNETWTQKFMYALRIKSRTAYQ